MGPTNVHPLLLGKYSLHLFLGHYHSFCVMTLSVTCHRVVLRTKEGKKLHSTLSTLEEVWYKNNKNILLYWGVKNVRGPSLK